MKRSVSVIIPNYNHARFIAQTLDAVVAQTLRPAVCYVLDDASTDNSAEVIGAYAAKHPWIRLVRHETNQGVLKTVDDLVALIDTDYFLAAASDDYVLPTFLESCMDLIERHPGVGLCSTLSFQAGEDGVPHSIWPCGIPSAQPVYFSPAEVRRRLERYGAWFMGNATVYNRQAFLDAGGYRPQLGAFVDSFCSHIMALRHGAVFIPEPLAVCRLMQTSYSSTTVADSEKLSNMIREAMALMTQSDELAGLFSPKYVSDWKKRKQFWLGEAQLAQRRHPGALGTVRHGLGFAALHARCFTWPATPLMLRWAFWNWRWRMNQAR